MTVLVSPSPSVETFYQQACQTASASAYHLPRLREFAGGCDLAIEFGVKKGASSAALLMGAQRVIGYDLVETKEARRLQGIAGPRYSYRIEDSCLAPVEPCDLLFLDSLHTYGQVQAELRRHAAAVRRLLVFHDVLTFGSIGADGETGHQCWTYQRGQSVPFQALGIRPAIDELMIEDASWRIVYSSAVSHGLLVLERR